MYRPVTHGDDHLVASLEINRVHTYAWFVRMHHHESWYEVDHLSQSIHKHRCVLHNLNAGKAHNLPGDKSRVMFFQIRQAMCIRWLMPASVFCNVRTINELNAARARRLSLRQVKKVPHP